MKSRKKFIKNMRLLRVCGGAIAINPLSIESVSCKQESIEQGSCMCGKIRNGNYLVPIQRDWGEPWGVVAFYASKSKITQLF